jgi:hypothetical protein
MNAYVPSPVHRRWVNRDDPVLISQFVEAREPLHVVSVLIHSVEKHDHRIVLLRVIAPRQTHQEVAIDILHRDLLLGLLRPCLSS